MTIRLVYFSGTGSTKYVAERFRDVLAERGHVVQFQALRHDAPIDPAPYERLIVCFAVHACNAPEPVLAWARTVPRSAGIPVALVSISGGGEVTPNLACRVALGRELRKRGYDVAFERSLVMPSNWMVAPQPLMVNKLLEVLPRKVTATCDAFLAGQRRRSHPGLGNRLLARLGRLERFGAREFGKRIRVGPDCNGCGSCARLCPVGNIVMADGKPRFGDRCSLCLACLYGCPTRALEPAVAKFVLLPDGYDMAKMARDHVPVGDFDVRAATKGFAWLGLRRYLLEAD